MRNLIYFENLNHIVTLFLLPFFMNHIKNFLPQLANSPLNKEMNWKLKLMSEWGTIMGSLTCKVSIHKIYNNTITLGVTDSCWMQELQMLSEIIKEKINNFLGTDRIELIRFKYVPEHKNVIKTEIKKSILVEKDKLLTSKELQALENIKDQELSQALQGFLKTCQKFS